MATPAQGIQERLTGTYGSPVDPLLSCTQNPQHVSFLEGGRRALVAHDRPVTDLEGKQRLQGTDTILSQDDQGITLRFDEESRLTEAGDLIIWVMRPALGVDGYCWGRTDWPQERCDNLRLRCPVDIPLG